MNEMVKLPINGGRLLPIRETDELRAKVGKLLWIDGWSVNMINSPMGLRDGESL